MDFDQYGLFFPSPSPDGHPVATLFLGRFRTISTLLVVQSLSSCCPVVVQSLTGQQLDNNWTTTGQRTELDVINHYPDFPKPGIDFIDIIPFMSNKEAYNQLVADLDANVHSPNVITVEARGFLFAAPLLTQSKLVQNIVPPRQALPSRSTASVLCSTARSTRSRCVSSSSSSSSLTSTTTHGWKP